MDAARGCPGLAAESRAYRFEHFRASAAESIWWISRLPFGSPSYRSGWWKWSANGAVSGISEFHSYGFSPKGRAAGICQRNRRCFAVA